MADPNLPLLHDAAGKLPSFLDEIVLVGGVTFGPPIYDQEAGAITGTTDVDVIAEIIIYGDYVEFSERLAKLFYRGRRRATSCVPMASWNLTLDVLLLSKEVLGFTNLNRARMTRSIATDLVLSRIGDSIYRRPGNHDNQTEIVHARNLKVRLMPTKV